MGVMPPRAFKRYLLRSTFTAVVIATFTLGGMALGLQAGSGDVQRTSFGTLETSVRPNLDGHVTVYVPLVDWRVHLLEHDAPVTVRIELRGIDRKRAGEGISSAAAASRSMDDVRRDTEQVIERAVQRAVVAASVGGLAGAVLAGAVLAGLLLRRRWLLVAPLFGAAVVAAVVVPSARELQRLDDQHVEVVAAGGHARELPVILRFAEQLLDVGDEYERHYATALRSVANLATFSPDAGHEVDTTALLVSDLHDNVFVLDALDRFAADTTVFATGDFVQVGARIEERTAGQVARLGGRLVAVSGNHDTPQYMSLLAEEGATVLDADEPMVTVDGLLVAGYPDPLEREPGSAGEHRLRVYGAEYARQQQDFIEWWQELDERPDVVLVHQHGLAHALVQHLAHNGDGEPLLLLAGHDHHAHVHADGPHVIVDGGTIGAGGIVAVGEQEASFAQLHLRDGRLVAVDLVAIEPLTGRASTERVEIPR